MHYKRRESITHALTRSEKDLLSLTHVFIRSEKTVWQCAAQLAQHAMSQF
jgi:hypothetical protein